MFGFVKRNWRQIIATLILVGCGLLLPALARASVTPHAGVLEYNTPVCGTNYVPVNLGHGDYFNIYNAQGGNTCVNVERKHLSWYVSRVTPIAQGWQYPNISSGWHWGRYTCNDGRSAHPGHGSQCMRYPVKQSEDGMPLTSVQYFPHLTNGNVSYDIWFNQTNAHPNQDNGSEIMIWLDDPGTSRFIHHAFLRRVRISGYTWDVCGWTMHRPDGTSWNYVAYVAPKPILKTHGLWLNEFFREAEHHGELSPDWYLTAIDFGSEMNVGGQGFAVKSYSLVGVR